MKTKTLLPNKHASIANKVINSSWDLTLVECRAIFIILSHIDSSKELDSRQKYTMQAGDYAELMEIPIKDAIKILTRGLDDLLKRTITVEEANGSFKKFHWIQSYHYDSEKQELGVRFTEDLLPYISKLSKDMPFARLVNKDFIPLESFYAMRLYALIVEDRGKKKRRNGEIWKSLEDIRSEWELPESYKEYKYMKFRAINGAIAAIERKGKIKIGLKERKLGRKVVEVGFSYEFKTEADD